MQKINLMNTFNEENNNDDGDHVSVVNLCF